MNVADLLSKFILSLIQKIWRVFFFFSPKFSWTLLPFCICLVYSFADLDMAILISFAFSLIAIGLQLKIWGQMFILRHPRDTYLMLD